MNLGPQLGGTLHFGPHLKDLLDLAIVHQLDRRQKSGMGMGQEEEWALERDMELPVLEKVLIVLDSSPLLQRKGADMWVTGMR